ncbi:hypothetical protein [Bailinhaonella thermotolerans]|nr:hypothetical protein [Bailinhaonella thermotolerans]
MSDNRFSRARVVTLAGLGLATALVAGVWATAVRRPLRAGGASHG